MLVEPGIENIPISRQCELLDLSKSTYYYEPVGETAENLLLMSVIDEIYTKYPYFGRRRMTVLANNDYNLGFHVNEKRVSRLLDIMGIQALYPKPNTSKPGKNHLIYPYLLKGVEVLRPNQVWATDITYVRMHNGFLYLVAIMDWFSRYVLSWELSNTMDVSFCIRALENAFRSGRPLIFNSDQGSQFTSIQYTELLRNQDIEISMNGKGRCHDNIFVERLWRTVKQEEVYLKDYVTVSEAIKSLGEYFAFYNFKRPHQSLDYETPFKIYQKGLL